MWWKDSVMDIMKSCHSRKRRANFGGWRTVLIVHKSLNELSVYLTDSVFLLPQALVMKVGMDSIMASYFALFEVINHSFGKICSWCFWVLLLKSSRAFSHTLLGWIWKPSWGWHHHMTSYFLNKDPCHTPSELNSLGLGVCVHVCVFVCSFELLGQVIWYRPFFFFFFNDSTDTCPSFYPSTHLSPSFHDYFQWGSWHLMSSPTSFMCRITRRQCRGLAWRSANGSSAFRRRSCLETTRWRCTTAFTR